METLNAEYETLKRELQENETYSQVQLELQIFTSVVYITVSFPHTHEALYEPNEFVPSQKGLKECIENAQLNFLILNRN